jgi:probable phosphoglycerate mutase
MKQIFILRHGETDLNRNGIVQGSGMDTQLNEFGQQQAQAFFKTYQDHPFEVVITSALRRTHQTLQGFIERGLPWEQWAEINEISWGVHEGQQSTPQMHEEYTALVRHWKAENYDAKIDGGESAQELAKRMQHFVDHLKSRPEKLVLVCSHGRAMRCLMCVLQGKPLYQMDHFKHANTGLYKLIYDGESFHFELENDLSHLENIPSL